MNHSDRGSSSWAARSSLGCEKGKVKPEGSENHRNGSSCNRIATNDDMLELNIPLTMQPSTLGS
jgi:hypothetical protein